jgi:hypothetical protein
MGAITGTPITAVLVTPFTFPGYSGTVSSQVFDSDGIPGGTLDFYYQVDVTTATVGITRLTLVAFDPSLGPLDVNNISVPGADEVADSAEWFGPELGFLFGASPAASRINAGESSYLLQVKTSALAYTTGAAAVIDGGSAGGLLIYAPTPEPSAYGAALALGVGALLWFRQRKLS